MSTGLRGSCCKIQQKIGNISELDDVKETGNKAGERQEEAEFYTTLDELLSYHEDTFYIIYSSHNLLLNTGAEIN